MSDTNFMSYSDAETVVTGIADKYKTFNGTQAQWDALSLADKVKYSFADITDDYAGTGVVDAVTNGDMNPVSSNAVYDYLNEYVEVTANGTETWAELLDRMSTLINISKLSITSKLLLTSTNEVYNTCNASLDFVLTKDVLGGSLSGCGIESHKIIIKSINSIYSIITETFNSSGVVTASLTKKASETASGKVRLYYR